MTIMNRIAPTQDSKELAENVKYWRNRARLSPREFAHRARVSAATIRRLEVGLETGELPNRPQLRVERRLLRVIDELERKAVERKWQ